MNNYHDVVETAYILLYTKLIKDCYRVNGQNLTIICYKLLRLYTIFVGFLFYNGI